MVQEHVSTVLLTFHQLAKGRNQWNRSEICRCGNDRSSVEPLLVLPSFDNPPMQK